jgi:hypothetical protein
MCGVQRIGVRLTDEDLDRAQVEAQARNESNYAAGRHGAHGAARYSVAEAYEANLIGAQAELGVLRYLTPALLAAGIEPLSMWRSFQPGDDPRTIRGDVCGWEIRASDRWPNMYVYPDDDNDAPFLKVLNCSPVMWLLGWCEGRDGKQPDWFRRWLKAPTFLVPVGALRPVLTPGQMLAHPVCVRFMRDHKPVTAAGGDPTVRA